MPSWPGIFQFSTFFYCCSEWIDAKFRLRIFSSSCNSFSCLSIRFFCHILFVQTFFYKIFFPCHVVVGMSSWIISLQAEMIFFLFFNVIFCLYCLILSRCLFSLLSFTSTFWFIYQSFVICFYCVAFLFSYRHIPAFFLSYNFFLLQ